MDVANREIEHLSRRTLLDSLIDAGCRADDSPYPETKSYGFLLRRDDRPTMARYFEDLEVGSVYEPEGRYEVTKDEVVSFAERYDPQPFHVDEEAASKSIFGSLAASGWHTASMCMRLLVDGFLDESSMGARGIDELRWKRPVHPGDTLRIELEIVDKRISESRPEVGHVRSKLTGYNQNDEVVIEWTALGMFRRRSAENEA